MGQREIFRSLRPDSCRREGGQALERVVGWVRPGGSCRISGGNRQSPTGWTEGGARALLYVACLSFAAYVTLAFAFTPAGAEKPGQEGQSQAKPIAGPPRGLPAPDVHAVEPSASYPAELYSATPRGLFVSSNSGQSWVALPVARTREEVFSVGVHPTDPAIVVAGRRDGLWKTGDGGRTWIPLASPTVGPYVPLAIAVAPSDPNVMFVATAREGVYRSDDGGYRWANAGKGLPEANAGGRTAEIRTMVVNPREPGTVYIAHERHGIYRTTDGGVTWHPFDKGLPPPAWRPTYPPRLAFDPRDSDRLYLVFAQPIHSRLTRNRLYATSVTGEWLPVEVDLPPNTTIVGLTMDPATRALHFWTPNGVLELLPYPKP